MGLVGTGSPLASAPVSPPAIATLRVLVAGVDPPEPLATATEVGGLSVVAAPIEALADDATCAMMLRGATPAARAVMDRPPSAKAASAADVGRRAANWVNDSVDTPAAAVLDPQAALIARGAVIGDAVRPAAGAPAAVGERTAAVVESTAAVLTATRFAGAGGWALRVTPGGEKLPLVVLPALAALTPLAAALATAGLRVSRSSGRGDDTEPVLNVLRPPRLRALVFCPGVEALVPGETPMPAPVPACSEAMPSAPPLLLAPCHGDVAPSSSPEPANMDATLLADRLGARPRAMRAERGASAALPMPLPGALRMERIGDVRREAG